MNKMHEHDDGEYIDCTGMGILNVEHRLKDYASRGNCGELTVVSSDGASWHSIFTPARWKEFKDGVNKSARIVDVWIKEVPGGADRYGLKERRHLPFKTMKESRSHEGMGECTCCGSNEHTGMLEDFLIRDGFNVDDACEILDMKPEDTICEECYDGSKKELNDKLYSEYNDLGTDVRTGERWGESHLRESPFTRTTDLTFGGPEKYTRSHKPLEDAAKIIGVEPVAYAKSITRPAYAFDGDGDWTWGEIEVTGGGRDGDHHIYRSRWMLKDDKYHDFGMIKCSGGGIAVYPYEADDFTILGTYDAFMETGYYVLCRGVPEVHAKIKESVQLKEARDYSDFKALKDMFKRQYKKFVHELKVKDNKVDAESLQKFLSEQLGRKVTFKTDNKKGVMYWELTEDETDQDDVSCTLDAYDIRAEMYGRSWDKRRIYINSGRNENKFDTSCWSKNVRAYRNQVAQDAEQDSIQLATIIMRCFNKIPTYGVESGKIFKASIMKVKSDGEWYTIGSLLDVERIAAMGEYLKRENGVENVKIDQSKDIAHRASVEFDYGWDKHVTIRAIVGAFCVNAEMKIDRKSFTEATKPSKSVLSKIKALDHVDSVYTFGSNIIVDLDTDNEYEADKVSYKIEDILGNNRKHGRDDLIGAGEFHINVGTVADFSEDSYRDLDPSVRDLYQIIVEPTSNYRMRREMDW